MIKRILIVSCLIFFFSLRCYAQKQSAFEDMRDSLLISMKQLILDDLSKDSIPISDRKSWDIGLGESFVFEVVFYDEKTSYIIMMLNATDSLNKIFSNQFKRRKLKKNMMMNAFRKSVNEYHELPYDLLDHFNYRFLILLSKEEKLQNKDSANKLDDADALYGEYKIKVDKEGCIIMDRMIEILKGEDVVKQKYRSYF